MKKNRKENPGNGLTRVREKSGTADLLWAMFQCQRLPGGSEPELQQGESWARLFPVVYPLQSGRIGAFIRLPIGQRHRHRINSVDLPPPARGIAIRLPFRDGSTSPGNLSPAAHCPRQPLGSLSPCAGESPTAALRDDAPVTIVGPAAP